MEPDLKKMLAVDLDPRNRPGVPKEQEPRPAAGAQFPIPQQASDVKIFRHGRPGKNMTPVFGTAQPPGGLAGLVRRRAYRYPDHMMRHWTMLLLADRVDVWQHRLRRLLPLAGAAALLYVARRTIFER